MQHFIDWVLSFVESIGYIEIGILMMIESSIIPFPSEVVMIPAGINAANGSLDPILATIIGGIGSLLGAIFNYFIVGKYL
jgi:membrane protein DedA with SNARE-associated domain